MKTLELYAGLSVVVGFLQILDGGRISIAALALGMARGAYDAAIRYSKEREQFGRPIADNQAIQWMIADSATEIAAARLLVRDAAAKKDREERITVECSMAKLYATEMASRVADRAVQVFGGNGYMSEYQVEQLCRDAKVLQIYAGTDEIQITAIAKDLLKNDANKGMARGAALRILVLPHASYTPSRRGALAQLSGDLESVWLAPEPERLVKSGIGYYLRRGKHDMTPADFYLRSSAMQAVELQLRQEHVLPMIPSGGAYKDIMLE